MRYGKSCSVKCCPFKPAVPLKYSCFWPKIFDQFEALLKRQYCMQTKNPTIHKMAIPLKYRSKFIRPCYCYKKSIELVYPDERQSTRTEQLALPSMRQFLAFKKSSFFKDFPQIRKDAFLRKMRASHYSMYTHLSNNKMLCMKKPEHKKPSKKQLKKILAHCEELAQPKEEPKEPEVDRGEQGEMSPERLKKLSTPKKDFSAHDKEPWRLTRGARYYHPSQRLIEISQPKPEPPSLINENYDKVNPKALRYRATAKIKEMAQPLVRPNEDSNFKPDAFSISPKALKAVASSRVKEMAEPKEYEDVHFKPDAFSVSPKALKAHASPRIIELAKPKTYSF